MTTLILQSAGAAVGAALGGPFGAILGRSLGTLAGNTVDQQLSGKTISREGARLSDMPGLASSEGGSIPRLYGRARLGGQVIWSTRFHETVASQTSGGKGIGSAPSVTTQTYVYHANLAIGLCEGPIAFVRRIWADGKLLDVSNLTIRLYRGDDVQDPDPLILAKEGAGFAPAYRGLAYLVFEHFPLADYGDRVPQFSFEIVKPVTGLNDNIRAINLIPGAGEFVYDPDLVTSVAQDGSTLPTNRHQVQGASDFEASLDQLLALCPNLKTVQLVVSWFGDDLRAGQCRIKPRVESHDTVTRETEWICAGHGRDTTPVVSLNNERPAYGGTPSDPSIVRAVRALKERGLDVVIYPFLMMDIPPGNTRVDPWTGASHQAAFPWRGRITTERASPRADTTDMTSHVDDECSAFFGTIQFGNMTGVGTSVSASPDEWTYRRFIFHYAKLLAEENIDGILIGSELRGLTRLQNGLGKFPFVTGLMDIAQTLRATLPSHVSILYAADWTEYGSYVLASGDIRFPLDPLFSHPAISAVGIDAYWPLSDWRDGTSHLDRSISSSIYDVDYLASRFGAGENFDWYYKSEDEGLVRVNYTYIDNGTTVVAPPAMTDALQDKEYNAPVFGLDGGVLIADIGRSAHINTIAIAPISSSYLWGGLYLTNIDIFLSNDAVSWTNFGRTPETISDSQLTRIKIDRVARFIKLMPTYARPDGADYWICLSEFQVEVRRDRDVQLRTPITDGAYNEPWIYRSKDLVNWWSKPHYERTGGIRSSTPTSWVPASKPIYLTEFGCPAVDRGANAPNLFADPKSSENALPPYSRGARDDLIQNRTLRSLYRRFDPASPGFTNAHNPVSTLYDGRMLDLDHSALWAWDARPYPEFPMRSDIWSDGANYETGHWLNGRLEGAALDHLIAAILRDADLPEADISTDQFLDGYVIDRPSSARAALEPLAQFFGFDNAVSSGHMRFFGRQQGTIASLQEDDFVQLDDKGFADITRAQENELPREVRLGFSDSDRLYRASSVTSRRLSGGAKGSINRDAAVMLRIAEAQRLADLALFDIWSRRETVKFRLRPGLIKFEPGDLVDLSAIGHRGVYQIERITDSVNRFVEAHALDPNLAELIAPAISTSASVTKPIFSSAPQARLMALPPVTSAPVTVLALAADARPWTGPLTIWRSVEGAAFSVFGSVTRPARIGKLLTPLAPGPVWRWDLLNQFELEMSGQALSARGETDALAAKPALAIETINGQWEIISYQNAVLIGENKYRISRLLRGLGGTENLAQLTAPQGRVVVCLDDAIEPLASGSDHLGETWAWRIVPAGLEVSDTSAVELIAPIGGHALKPLAPVHLEARRSADGIGLSWFRRARENGDSWGVAEIALDEADERYEIEILKNASVVRILSATEQKITYGNSFILADFGQPITKLHVRIYQLSRAVGRGAMAEADLIIR